MIRGAFRRQERPDPIAGCRPDPRKLPEEVRKLLVRQGGRPEAPILSKVLMLFM